MTIIKTKQFSVAVGSENCGGGIPDLILGGPLDDLIQFLRFLGFQENT
jgi:hypothetical protein